MDLQTRIFLTTCVVTAFIIYGYRTEPLTSEVFRFLGGLGIISIFVQALVGIWTL